MVTDSVTAMLYLNKAGGRVPSLMDITKKILTYALDFNISLSAEYITSKDNELADSQSRDFQNPHIEVRVKPFLFKKINKLFGPHDVDAFAAMENHHLKQYVSWRPDPYSMYPDLFSRTFPRGRIYCFPPFTLVLRLLTKISQEEKNATVILPFWIGQPFWPIMLDLLTEWPAILPLQSLQSPKGIFNRNPVQQHQLLACSLSGSWEKRRAFQAMRSNTHFDATSPTTLEEVRPSSITTGTFPSTRYSELRGMILRPSIRTPAF
jgi:hypothetical protein